MFEQPLTFIDVETTGASSKFGGIIEIGLLRVEGGRLVRTYNSFVNPEQPIPEFITRMTGIRESDVVGAPTFADIADEVSELFRESVFVAHNAAFDYSFMQEEFRRVGQEFTMPRLCTVRLSRALFPEHRHHNLSALIERHGFVCKNRHRAYDDAEVLWQFVQMLHETLPDSDFQASLKRLIQPVFNVRSEMKKETFVYERDSQEIDNHFSSLRGLPKQTHT